MGAISRTKKHNVVVGKYKRMQKRKKSQKRCQFKEYRSISSLARQIYANYHAMSKYQEGLKLDAFMRICLWEEKQISKFLLTLV